jgi:hypothetical protein
MGVLVGEIDVIVTDEIPEPFEFVITRMPAYRVFFAETRECFMRHAIGETVMVQQIKISSVGHARGLS